MAALASWAQVMYHDGAADTLHFYFLDFNTKNAVMNSLSDSVTQECLHSLQPASQSLGITIAFKRNPTDVNGFLKIKASFILFKSDSIM